MAFGSLGGDADSAPLLLTPAPAAGEAVPRREAPPRPAAAPGEVLALPFGEDEGRRLPQAGQVLADVELLRADIRTVLQRCSQSRPCRHEGGDDVFENVSGKLTRCLQRLQQTRSEACRAVERSCLLLQQQQHAAEVQEDGGGSSSISSRRSSPGRTSSRSSSSGDDASKAATAAAWRQGSCKRSGRQRARAPPIVWAGAGGGARCYSKPAGPRRATAGDAAAAKLRACRTSSLAARSWNRY
eukprot:TRINITY_DN6702_c0_g1_i2.p1 TRINITY_DN6702_c0_g1~~TRINITY_DN6702_c0_g1_i2.p1  ORF type:complete len:261 (+),score=45.60 TRINITY_DN6702_c0_g1_i2:58-783(+)